MPPPGPVSAPAWAVVVAGGVGVDAQLTRADGPLLSRGWSAGKCSLSVGHGSARCMSCYGNAREHYACVLIRTCPAASRGTVCVVGRQALSSSFLVPANAH